MKRAAVGVLLISLVAGSTAMAGTVLGHRFERDHNDGKRNEQQHRPDNRHDDRRRHNPPRRDDRHDNDHRSDRRDDHSNHRDDGRRNYGDRDNRGRHDDRRDDRRWDNHRWDDRGRQDHRWESGRYHWGAYYRPHGYVVRRWGHGDRLPRAYYAPTYVIGNYDECGLRRPPHGHHWVRIDHDAVLAVIATGVVLDVIYNQFW